MNALLAFRHVSVLGRQSPPPKLPLFLKPDRKLTRSLPHAEKAKKVYSDQQIFAFVNHPHFLRLVAREERASHTDITSGR